MQPLQCAQQVWWSLHWVLRPGYWAGGLWRVRFCRMLEFSRCGGAARQPQCTEPCQCVGGQAWACHGPLEGQMQSLQCAAGIVEACTGCFGWGGQQVVCGVWDFAECWSFPDVGVLLSNRSAQSPAGMPVTRPGHIIGHCKVKCSLCSVQKVWWSLHWVQWPGWAGGLWGYVILLNVVEFPRYKDAFWQSQCTEPC